AILITVICRCWFAPVKRTVAVFVVWWTVFIPIFAQALVAGVFSGPHRYISALIDVQHFATVFRFFAIEHLARPDGAATVRVVLVAYGLHFTHVFLRDRLVSAFVEHDAWAITVVDNGIAHEVFALLPTCPFHVALGIAGRHCLQQPHTVARLDILLPRGDVHPSHQVGIAFDHEAVAEIAEPRRNRHPYRRPLVAGALCIPLHHQYPVVEVHHAVAKIRLPEARF